MFFENTYNKVYIFFENRGIYIGKGNIYKDFRYRRAMCKTLKGGYIVVRDGKKHEVVRMPLKIGFLLISHEDVVVTQSALAERIEFWTANRHLVYWTEL